MYQLAVPDRSISLKDVMPSALHALGIASAEAALPIPQSRHVVIVLIDGLGEFQLREHIEYAPVFQNGSNGFIPTEFPSTTPVALASLGTGLSPGRHGVVGASFWVPEDDQMLKPLKWGSTPHPLSIAPDKTMFERAVESGVDTATIAPTKHRQSGLTRSVLRGAEYLGASSFDEILEVYRLRRTKIAARESALTYIYWPDLDRVGHVSGVGSIEWIDALVEVNRLLTALVESLRTGESLVVTSDHGMVTCPAGSRTAIEEHPDLCESLLRIGGEPRSRHLYFRAGSQLDAQITWRSFLGERVHILTREECIENGLYQVTDHLMAARIGDLVAISAGDHMLTSREDSRTSRLLGQHGALTQEEIYVPLRIFNTAFGA